MNLAAPLPPGTADADPFRGAGLPVAAAETSARERACSVRPSVRCASAWGRASSGSSRPKRPGACPPVRLRVWSVPRRGRHLPPCRGPAGRAWAAAPRRGAGHGPGRRGPRLRRVRRTRARRSGCRCGGPPCSVPRRPTRPAPYQHRLAYDTAVPRWVRASAGSSRWKARLPSSPDRRPEAARRRRRSDRTMDPPVVFVLVCPAARTGRCVRRHVPSVCGPTYRARESAVPPSSADDGRTTLRARGVPGSAWDRVGAGHQRRYRGARCGEGGVCHAATRTRLPGGPHAERHEARRVPRCSSSRALRRSSTPAPGDRPVSVSQNGWAARREEGTPGSVTSLRHCRRAGRNASARSCRRRQRPAARAHRCGGPGGGVLPGRRPPPWKPGRGAFCRRGAPGSRGGTATIVPPRPGAARKKALTGSNKSG